MTSSKFDTNNKLQTSIQYLKGVGPKFVRLFESKGICNVYDALFYFPRDYQDRSKIKPIKLLYPEEYALVCGTVTHYHFISVRKLKRPILEAQIQDQSGTVALKWFHYNRAYFEAKLKDQPRVLVYGQVKAYGSLLHFVHPEMEWDIDDEDQGFAERIMPVYSETEGLPQRTLRRVISQAISMGLPELKDDIPDSICKKQGLVSIVDAIRILHSPPKEISVEQLRNFQTPAQKRLIFDEFFKFELIVGLRRIKVRTEETKPYLNNYNLKIELPFELTNDQKNAISKIYQDLAQTKPMTRLLQGDVGCGKTLVAFYSTLPVIAAGGQVALMAPTEILAEQHFTNAVQYLVSLSLPLQKRKLRIALLTGSTPKSLREEILSKLTLGETDLLIGTHALIEDEVRFKELGLIIVDEQHRFGVDQRMKLRLKGNNPHLLSLTATPIPRTLAMTAYGDLDVSVIRELPQGRAEIFTKIISNKGDRSLMYKQIKEQLKQGRQAYVIYPLVEESEKIDLANAVSGAEELANHMFQEFRVGLLHGKMKSQEKSEIMSAFKAGHIQILVSTTVVEVGVDVPNASVLAVENAERFGLSQLHQLRGRIGRSSHTSYCFLATAGASKLAYERLTAMEKTRDGFKLAELDLAIRGPGEFLGTKQSGELQFKYASLIRDQELLQEARLAAFEILKTDPELQLPQHTSLRLFMEHTGHLQKKRFETA